MLKRTTEEVRIYFEEHDCELLDEYRGAIIPMKYRCSCGRISKMSWNNFTKGKRCGFHGLNGRVKRYTIEEVKAIFKNHGCELLDKEYKNVHSVMKYICKCGRKARISLAAILHQNQYCRKCGTERTAQKLRKEGSKEYRKFYYKYRKSLRRTLAALKKDKLDYSHKLLGYSARDLQYHITNHPNWKNVKDADWHLDHIFPVKAFIEHGISDIKLINALGNLQPLSQQENNQKSDNYDEQDFKAWLLKPIAVNF